MAADDKQRLRDIARACKEHLTSSEEFKATLPASLAQLGDAGSVTMTVPRTVLDDAMQPVLQRLAAPLERLQKDYKLALKGNFLDLASNGAGAHHRFAPPPRQVTQLVLVGGSTRMPAIRSFAEQMCGRGACTGVDPEHAVALGAALHAGLMEGSVSSGLEMTDSVYVQKLQGRTSGFQM